MKTRIFREIRGNRSTAFNTCVTIKVDKDKDGRLVGNDENYIEIGNFRVQDVMIMFDSPRVSVSTFFWEVN